MSDEPEETVEAGGDVPKASSFEVYRQQKKEKKSYGFKRVHVMPGGHTSYHLTVPTLPEEKSSEYVPMTYVFRFPQQNLQGKLHAFRGKSPPFEVLFDHTVAVIWILLSKESYDCPCGIAQVQWAYNFLKTIRKSEGDHSKDVKCMLEIMQRALVQLYQKAQEEDLEKITEMTQQITEEDNFDLVEIPFSATYSELKQRGAAAIDLQNAEKLPQLNENELIQRVSEIVKDLQFGDDLSEQEKKLLVQHFFYYKQQLKNMCEERMDNIESLEHHLPKALREVRIQQNIC